MCKIGHDENAVVVVSDSIRCQIAIANVEFDEIKRPCDSGDYLVALRCFTLNSENINVKIF